MHSEFSDKAAIVGIGQTEFSKKSGRSELRLAVEAVKAAIADAGLDPADIDGMTTFSHDTNPEIDVARALGIPELKFMSRIHYGGGAACAVVQQAAMAVLTGVAKYVVVYRAFNERSGRRFGVGQRNQPTGGDAEQIAMSWLLPFGLVTPASWVAMFARRYMHEFGATSEDFGRVSVVDRKHAANNPNAWFYGKPITLEDHQNSPWIVDPLHLLDCCQESDGGVALVVTTAERARDMPNVPAYIRAAAQGAADDQHMMTSYYRPDDKMVELPEMALVARQLYATSGLAPEDINAAIIYDHFTPFVLPQLEAFGFCGRGEAKDFIRDGNLELHGSLPLNTHGGQLGEAYIHGVNGVLEAVRQIRGTSSNQVDELSNVLVTAGTGVPTSGLILGRQ
ncbi:lipid-transfer protein [Sphaerimonospora mesophila]|uniref:lipid-transfer protein n=1 Tax=Sphaerimonospora mesophila TaxID=37483 RepID=UPI0006E2BC25